MNNKWTLLAKLIVKLDKEKFTYQVNKPHKVTKGVAGYQRVQIDLAVFDTDGNFMGAFYVGPKKNRRMFKYKLLKVPVYYVHEEEDIAK